MRRHLIILAAAAFPAGVGLMLQHEMRNPGSVRSELAVVSPRVAEGAVPTVERVVAVSSPDGLSDPSSADATSIRTDLALDALSDDVGMGSHPDALRLAFQAYFNYKAANRSQVRKPYLYFVDYGLDNRTPRGYVFDMEALQVVDGPFMVAHGRGSSKSRDGVPTSFSNRNGSAATSLGLFVAQETYAFGGTSGGQRYRSIGLRLKGVSGSFNSAARSRGVVVHGAPYVSASQAGRSEGCPAMEPARAQHLIPLISNGSLVFLFSPLDSRWMASDPWVNPARMADAGARRPDAPVRTEDS